MKMKKIIAMLLALVMVSGLVAACGKKDDSTTDATKATSKATEVTEPVDDTTATTTLTSTTPENVVDPAQNVTDEDTTPVVIYTWNTEFTGLLDKYYVAENPDFTYEAVTTETSGYQTALDAVLSSGDGAPDIFLLEADYCKKYVDGDYTLNINELGIDYAELASEFGYTYELMQNADGSIRALSWQCNPSVVFYNNTLAETYLGSSDPTVVGESFATWDAFLAMAEQINTDSAGVVKAISGTDDIWRSYLNSRETGWLDENGEVYVDPSMESYYDMSKTMYDEGLTFETTQWGADWSANMANQTVLSYWGPMWFINFCMGFNADSDGNIANEATLGDWNCCAAPTSFFWGGTWIAASTYDNNKATTADIMRFFTIDYDSMLTMGQNGECVNNLDVLTTLANDASFGVDLLSGNNPFSLLLSEAGKIDVSTLTADDSTFNTNFQATVTSYNAGDIATVAEAEEAFIAACTDAGLGA